jgi:hypothetical protein
LSCSNFLNHKTLLAGEVNSGKTERTLKIFRDFMECRHGPLAVLDLAPETVRGIGGKLPLTPQEKEGILYLSPLILPPRLLGKDEEEIQKLARENRIRIEKVLEGFQASQFSILIINDVSLYFHDGDARTLLSFLDGIPTVIMNGYYGSYFGESALSRKERREMETLMARCSQVFLLSPANHSSP